LKQKQSPDTNKYLDLEKEKIMLLNSSWIGHGDEDYRFNEFLTCNVTKMWFQLKMHEFLCKCPTAKIYCQKMHGYWQNIPMPVSSPTPLRFKSGNSTDSYVTILYD
jgi:hypothetical protein